MQITINTAIQNAYAAIRQRNFSSALAFANSLLKHYPQDPRSWNLLCEIHRERGAMPQASQCAKKAASLAPHLPNYWIQYGRCLALSGRRSEAVCIADRAANLQLDQPVLWDALGSIYSLADEPAKAKPLYLRAVNAEPTNDHYHYNLASCLRMLGQLDDAEKHCEAALELRPAHYEACYVRADLKTWSREHNHIVELKNQLDKTHNPRAQIYLGFALAKELEDCHHYQESFNVLKNACDLKRRTMQYRVSDDITVIDTLISTHTKEALAEASNGYNSAEPIFILGLPRSGTTLVERILSSHSQVYSAGELNEFAFALLKTANNVPGQQTLSKQALVERSLSLDLEKLGQTYINSTRPRTGHTRYFIDKLPLNYLYCGLIKAALPKAKIILLERNVMDVCYAMYKTLFTLPYPFTYHLEDIADYYGAYQRLVHHWQHTLGDRLLTIHYETLVQEPQLMIRKLIEFCELPPEDACFEFHKNPNASSTASAVQVRSPIYTSSLGKWRHYSQELLPLAVRLQRVGVSVS